MISHKRLTDVLSYDPNTGEFRWKKPTCGGLKFGGLAGSVNRQGYIEICINSKKYLAHRLAWLFVHKECPRQEIDHINHDRGDNRIGNLRQASHSENQHNQRIPKNNKSGRKGVHWNTRARKWVAMCAFNGKQNYAGSFDDLDEADQAVRALRERLHGEFTAHN